MHTSCFYFTTKLNEKRILFYSNFISFSFSPSLYLSIFLSPEKFHHVSISTLKRGLVRAQLRALFTLASARAFIRPKVGLREEAVQNLLSLSMSEWHAENASSGKEEVFNAWRLSLFYGRDHLGRWRAACFRLGRARIFLADISRWYLVARREHN